MDLIKPPARKGEKNRVSLNCRVDERTFEVIKQLCEKWGKSQGEVIDTWADNFCLNCEQTVKPQNGFCPECGSEIGSE